MSFRHVLAIVMAAQVIAIDHALASLGDGDVKLNSLSGTVIPSPKEASKFQEGQWFKLKKSVMLNVMEREGSDDNVNVRGDAMNLPRGTEVSIEEVSPDKRFVLIGIDEDLDEPVGVDPSKPTLAWVDVDRLTRGSLIALNTEEIEIEGLNQFATDEDKIEYDETVEARRGGRGRVRRAGGRGRGGGMTYCMRDVRLGASRYTCGDNIPDNVPIAAEGYSKYRAAGWIPVEYSPSNPLGTACFQGGGRMCPKEKKRCGHASIKVGPNRWKGAGTRPVPFLNNSRGKVYFIQGCLTPPKSC